MIDSKKANSIYLGVEKSLTGRRWVQKQIDERKALMFSQRLGLSEIAGRIIASRGIDIQAVEVFLNPTLRYCLPNPSSLRDMDRAAERVAAAIMMNEKIGVFGDYDVDGATSSALLKRFFRAVGGRSTVYIPDRIIEGYGPNGPALLKLKESGVSIVITVDCGTMAVDPLKTAKDAGLDVIVVDHHAAESNLPPALAIVNPNRVDDESGQGELAAVGVCFLLIVAVNRVLRDLGWYNSQPEPDLRQWLDIVALGTICDVVPLKGLNRAFVVQGLKVMANRKNPGLRALADITKLDEEPRSFHLGYIFGPRINAGGRVGAANLGALLLSTDDFRDANAIAHRLDEFNTERKLIEEEVLQKALSQIETNETNQAIAFAAGKGWHPGVLGIVATRLTERFNRPAFVIALDKKTDLGVGSGRSIFGVDLGAIIIAARQAGLLEKGGGHKTAAGFTLSCHKLEKFKRFVINRIGKRIDGDGITPEIFVDGSVGLGGVTLPLITEIEKIAPFGSGNPEPIFAIPNVNISHAQVVGGSHVRISINKPQGGQLTGIAFRAVDRPHGQALLNHEGKSFHIAGKLRMNSWQGRISPQIQIEDLAPVW